MPTTTFDWQGHRGCRGILPENTIPAFIKALDLGVNTLEMDLAISKDSVVVVSHEPWMSHEICLTPEKDFITEENEKEYKLFEMNFATISTFDCGTRDHARFPDQASMEVSKPSLMQVFEASEAHIKAHQLAPCFYNIEIKSRPDWDSILAPTPDVFSELLVKDLKASRIDTSRFIIQSFDPRTLQYLHEHHPEFTLSFLIAYAYNNTQILIDSLGFTPPIISPDYTIISQQQVGTAQQMGMRVIPWTINDTTDIQKLLDWGVDGIITDYPDIIHHFK